MQIPVLLDRASSEGLVAQIAGQLRAGIRTLRIPVGAKLPSSRRLADQLEVSRNTVVRAYEILESEGCVEARPASGFFASAALERPTAPSPPETPPPAAGLMPPPFVAPRAQQAASPAGTRLAFDFSPGRASPTLFPLKTWRRLVNATLSGGSLQGLVGYSDPGGLSALRAAIATHLALSSGIVADPSQIVVTCGIQEGLNLAARLFLGPDRQAVIETPCYQGAVHAFADTGARMTHVPVDHAGLVTEALPREPAALIHVTPSHQYPIGATLSPTRRAALVDWARAAGCYILENDYGGDSRYDGSPLPAVAATAPDCTIHVGTFSRSLGAGLRLGYMVVPPPLIEPVRDAKALLDNGSAWLEQAVLAEFIRSGSFAVHVQRCRTQYRQNRDMLIHALRRHFGDVEFTGEAAGLHILWQLPPGVPHARQLEAMARRARIGLRSFVTGGVLDTADSSLAERAIILGFAALTPVQIEQGIARLSDLIDDALDAKPDFLGDLLVDGPTPFLRHDRPAPKILRKAALRSPRPCEAVSGAIDIRQGSGPMQIVRGIYRYPVKGLSPQPVSGVMLEPDKPFPFDRVFALARPGAGVDPREPKWAKKGLFVMLMLEETLASVRTDVDPETMTLTVTENGSEALVADLATDAGRESIERFVARLAPSIKGLPKLVHSRSGHFMDKPDNVLSLINLATLRSLEQDWGVVIDPLRFRANFYVDGFAPWEEFDWIGSDILLISAEN